LGKQAHILHVLGRLDEALEFFQQQALISRQISLVDQLILVLGKKAKIE